MQSAETVLDILREITGEPGAGKPARRVREGDAGKGPKGTSPASYLALWDEDFGPGFIKICAYFPYPIKIWLNGHHWTQRQAAQAGIGVTPLAAGSNSFASTTDPAGLGSQRAL